MLATGIGQAPAVTIETDERDEARGPLRRIADPLEQFLHDEAAGGLALVVATVAALLWANLAGDGYSSFWDRGLDVGAGELALRLDLRHWVNDGLMAIFFFVVGLEIKRELVAGELRDRRAAALAGAGRRRRCRDAGADLRAVTAGTPRGLGLGDPRGDRHRLRHRRPRALGRPRDARA